MKLKPKTIILIVVIPIIVVVMNIQMNSADNQWTKNIASLKSLTEQDVEKIIVYDYFGGNMITTITDKQALDEFRESFSDVEDFRFNHDRSTHNWDLVLEGQQRRYLSLAFIDRCPNSAVGRYEYWEPNRMTNLGQLESKKLRGWLEKYLVNDNS